MKFCAIFFVLSLFQNIDCSNSFETYVKYDVRLPLYNVPNEEIVGYFRFEDDSTFDFGKTVIFDSCVEGWLRIEEIYTNIKQESFKGKWISAEYAKISTTNYAYLSSVYMYETPSENRIVVNEIAEITELSPLLFCNGWVLVEHGGIQGWLSPESICTNEVTNCN